MIAALLLGREGSVGFPGKNTYPVLGRPLMLYPMMAAMNAPSVARCYLSTDAESYKAFARGLGWRIIDRPAHLASKEALGEDAFRHGYEVIKDEAVRLDSEIELLVLLFCNAPTVTADLIERGIALLRERPDLDSAVSVSSYNMWSPVRARRELPDGTLQPFVPFAALGVDGTVTCDRDSQGDVWFADMGMSIVRPHCLEHLETGLLPQRWMGQRIGPVRQWGGLDVDFEWQIPLVEFWLRRHGFDEHRPPYETGHTGSLVTQESR